MVSPELDQGFVLCLLDLMNHLTIDLDLRKLTLPVSQGVMITRLFSNPCI